MAAIIYTSGQMVMPILSINNLVKRYKGASSNALGGVSLSINKAEVYGFLGPNGAGKSTTIRVILNFLLPTSGSVSIFGLDSVKYSTKIKSHIGYLAGDVALYDKLTGSEFLKYMTDLQPLKDKKYAAGLLKRFEMDKKAKIGTLSKGNKQKLGIIQAFMHQPELLVLDEPAGGLDPLMQEIFYDIVAETKARGASVFISSHNLGEVQKICDRVGFIKNGILVAQQNVGELANNSSKSFTVEFTGKPPIGNLKTIPKLKIVDITGEKVKLSVQGDLDALLGELAKSKVKNLYSHEVQLEDEFMHYYGGGEAK